MPADPFARSAVSPQRSLLAAQSPRSAVSVIPSKPGRAPGVGPKKGGPRAQGRARGPGGDARCARARADARFARGGPSGPRGPAYTQQKLFRTEEIIRNENYSVWNPYKRKKMYKQVKNIEYARNTYTNSQPGAVSSDCRSGSKDDPLLALPHSITKRTRYTFGRLFEPVQRPAGQVAKMDVMNVMNPINVICMESSTPTRRRRAENSLHAWKGNCHRAESSLHVCGKRLPRAE